MRHVKHNDGRRSPQQINDALKGEFIEIVISAKGRGRGQQHQIVRALRQQAIKHGVVQAIRRVNGVRDTLQRVLIEVDPGRSKRQIKVSDDRGHSQSGGDRPGDVVRDRGRADAALGSVDGDDAPERRLAGLAVKTGNHANEIKDVDGFDEIFADAARDQGPIEFDVIGAPHNDDACRVIAELGERVEAGEEPRAFSPCFQHEDIRRRLLAVGGQGGRDPTGLRFQSRLLHAPISGGAANQRRHGVRFAKRVDGHARNRRDQAILGEQFGAFGFRHAHLLPPTTIVLSLQAVAGSTPSRTLPMARVRIWTSLGLAARGASRSRGSSSWVAIMF